MGIEFLLILKDILGLFKSTSQSGNPALPAIEYVYERFFSMEPSSKRGGDFDMVTTTSK